MKRATLTLVAVASGSYYAILFLARSLFPEDFNPPPYFLAVPLLVLVLVLVSDLSYRATVPTEPGVRTNPSQRFSQEVQDLTRQIQVSATSSPAYFDRAVIGRLRDAMVAKVAFETGIEPAIVRGTLADPRLGPALLKNEKLHRFLYSPPAGKGPARVRMLEEAVALAESWKP